jgi:type I restriction enzyme S subunit
MVPPKNNSTSLMRVPTPTRAEQDEIVAFLQVEVSKLDTLAEQAQGAIALLKERRAALISAAVTGKIDVRGLADARQDAA